MAENTNASGTLKEILDDVEKVTLATTRNKMLIANKIRKAMIDKGMKNKDLGQLVGKNPTEISLWLTGDRNLTISTMTIIEQALGITLLDTKPAEINLF